jgi:hypothetical protein
MPKNAMTAPVRAAYKALAELRSRAETRRQIADVVVAGLEQLPADMVRQLAEREDLEHAGYMTEVRGLLIRADVQGIASQHLHRAAVLAVGAASRAMTEGGDDV